MQRNTFEERCTPTGTDPGIVQVEWWLHLTVGGALGGGSMLCCATQRAHSRITSITKHRESLQPNSKSLTTFQQIVVREKETNAAPKGHSNISQHV
jgi:hypothetical protein